MGRDAPKWEPQGAEPVRDHIICVTADEGVRTALHRELAAWLGEAYILDAVSSVAQALQLFDDVQRAGDTVAVLLVAPEPSAAADSAAADSAAASGPAVSGPAADGAAADNSSVAGVANTGLGLLTEAHQRFPLSAKVLLIDLKGPSGGSAAPVTAHAETLAQAVRQAGLSTYLHCPYEPLQLRLTLEGLLFQHRLQRKNERLHYTLQEQKRELEVMNHNLEARIRERTMALEEANRRLSQLAVTDGLTGLYNHRYLQEHLVLEVERSLRTGIPLGMLMVDVDNFRLYNNRFGHQTGDEVLRRVARLIGEHRRVNDVVARYGGEEFALLLINADHRVAANIAERLRARVCAEPFPQNHELPGGMLTISVGVASCPTDATTAASLLAAADAALFRAKHAGRNQVRVAGESSEVFYVNVAVASTTGEEQLVAVAAAGGAPEKW